MAHVGSSELFLQDFLPEQICIYIYYINSNNNNIIII